MTGRVNAFPFDEAICAYCHLQLQILLFPIKMLNDIFLMFCNMNPSPEHLILDFYKEGTSGPPNLKKKEKLCPVTLNSRF